MLVITSEIFFREKTEFRKRYIKGADGVAFAKNEAISMRAGGMGGVDFENTPIKSDEQVHTGKRAGKVGALRLVRHANEAKADFAGKGFEVGGHG
jgi:succinyl-CoA synthetase beta subunit